MPARADKTIARVKSLMFRPPGSSINDSTALAAPAGPERSPPTIPTEPKAFRGVPEEPRAMSTAAPQTCSPYFACAVSIAPVSQDQSLQAKVSLSTAEEPKETKDEDIESLIREQELEQRLDEIQNAREKERVAAAPRDSPTTPNQVNEARGMNHSDSTALQNHQPSHAAVISSPPPSHHDNPAEPANPNPFATVGRPVVSIGPLDHETQLVSGIFDLTDELSYVLGLTSLFAFNRFPSFLNRRTAVLMKGRLNKMDCLMWHQANNRFWAQLSCAQFDE
jgi:hypothetical protein